MSLKKHKTSCIVCACTCLVIMVNWHFHRAPPLTYLALGEFHSRQQHDVYNLKDQTSWTGLVTSNYCANVTSTENSTQEYVGRYSSRENQMTCPTEKSQTRNVDIFDWLGYVHESDVTNRVTFSLTRIVSVVSLMFHLCNSPFSIRPEVVRLGAWSSHLLPQRQGRSSLQSPLTPVFTGNHSVSVCVPFL